MQCTRCVHAVHVCMHMLCLPWRLEAKERVARQRRNRRGTQLEHRGVGLARCIGEGACHQQQARRLPPRRRHCPLRRRRRPNSNAYAGAHGRRGASTRRGRGGGWCVRLVRVVRLVLLAARHGTWRLAACARALSSSGGEGSICRRGLGLRCHRAHCLSADPSPRPLLALPPRRHQVGLCHELLGLRLELSSLAQGKNNASSIATLLLVSNRPERYVHVVRQRFKPHFAC